MNFHNLFRWASPPPQQLLKACMGALGMGLPLLLAMQSEHLGWGLLVCTGCLVMSDAEFHHRWRQQLRILLFLFSSILGATLLCLLLHELISDTFWREGAMVASIFLLAIIAHYSMPLAVWMTRLSVYTIMMSGILLSSNSHPEASLPLLTGALWMGSVLLLGSLVLGLYRNYRSVRSANNEEVPIPHKALHLIQRLEYWYKTLFLKHTWRYPSKLLFCLSCTWYLQYIWPSHHFQWSALTIGILLQRNPEGSTLKAMQRGLGTVLGVLAASIFLYIQPHHYVLLLFVTVFAGLRVFLKPCNYLLYTVSVTPLMMLILSSQEDLYSSTILWDRLVATLVAIGLVFVANFFGKVQE